MKFKYFGLPIIILISCLIYTGCSYKYIDKRTEKYYNDFVELYNLNCNNSLEIPHYFIIKLTNSLEDGIAGECISFNDNFKMILLKQSLLDFYDNNDEDTKIALIYHELTHCLLNLGHSKNPDNYMAPMLNYSLFKEDVIRQYLENVHKVCTK